MDCIKDVPLGAAPERGDQQVPGAVSGQAMDHDIRAQNLCAGQDHPDIGFQGEDLKWLLLIVCSQVCPFQDMQQLQFYSLNIPGVQVADGLKHPVTVFSGKAKDYMGDDLNSPVPKAPYCIFESGEGITSAYECCCIFVHGLKTQLNPYRLNLIQFCQKVKDRRLQTIWSGGNGQKSNIRMENRFCKDRAQVGYRGIGIGICLKVSNIAVDRAFVLQTYSGLLNLSMYGKSGIGGKVAGSAGTTEDTSAGSNPAVSVGTGHAGIERKPVDFFSITLFQFVVERVIRFIIP